MALFLIFFLAVMNVMVGFALAVHSGRKYAQLLAVAENCDPTSLLAEAEEYADTDFGDDEHDDEHDDESKSTGTKEPDPNEVDMIDSDSSFDMDDEPDMNGYDDIDAMDDEAIDDVDDESSDASGVEADEAPDDEAPDDEAPDDEADISETEELDVNDLEALLDSTAASDFGADEPLEEPNEVAQEESDTNEERNDDANPIDSSAIPEPSQSPDQDDDKTAGQSSNQNAPQTETRQQPDPATANKISNDDVGASPKDLVQEGGPASASGEANPELQQDADGKQADQEVVAGPSKQEPVVEEPEPDDSLAPNWMEESPEISSRGDRPLLAEQIADTLHDSMKAFSAITGKMAVAMQAYHLQMSDHERAVFTLMKNDTRDMIHALLPTIQQTVEQLLQQLQAYDEQFKAELKQCDSPPLQVMSQIVQKDYDAESARLRAIQGCVTRFPADRAGKSDCRRLHEAIDKSLGANHNLLDSIDATLIGTQTSIETYQALSPSQLRDPDSGVANRLGLKLKVLELMHQQAPGSSEVISFTLIDIDDMTTINGKYGQNVGDRLVAAIAKLIRQEKHEHCFISRVSGQQIALLYFGMDPQVALSETERMRQFIEKVSFIWDGQKIRVTASAMLSSVSTSRNSAETYSRILEAIRKAKSNTKRRTYLIKDNQIRPIAPPTYKLTPHVINI